MSAGTCSVLIADDHEVVRHGLRTILSVDPLLEIVGEAADGEEAYVEGGRLQPDVVVMDLWMPRVNGTEATRRLSSASPRSAVIAFTAHEEVAYVREAISAGAKGYVLKRTAAQHLHRSIEVVRGGGIFIDPAFGHRIARTSLPALTTLRADLTRREIEVASLVASGHSNKEISVIMRVSVKTVETHKTRLMRKLGLETRTELVRYAIYRGWLVA